MSGMTSLQIMDAVVEALADAGIATILDNHMSGKCTLRGDINAWDHDVALIHVRMTWFLIAHLMCHRDTFLIQWHQCM